MNEVPLQQLTSEFGKHQTVKARFWHLSECGTYTTVKATFWPWRSGESPLGGAGSAPSPLVTLRH